ncbi:unnamed protein product [Effrenium voratum]|nr:unnamed protein product [Effrenium voratum]
MQGRSFGFFLPSLPPSRRRRLLAPDAMMQPPAVAPGTVEIAGGPKLSRSEARRLREEERQGMLLHQPRLEKADQELRKLPKRGLWLKPGGVVRLLGGRAKVPDGAPEEEDPKKKEERERSRSREKKETLDRLAKTAAEKAALAVKKAEEGEEGEGEGEAKEVKKINKAEEAKQLLAKEKEKARLKKQAMVEARKEEEMKKKMAVLEKDLNKSDRAKYKRY